MRNTTRFNWFFLVALLLGISGSAVGSDARTIAEKAATSKDAVLD